MSIKQKGFIQHHFLGAKSGAGFTIIELLVVIAIIGLLSSVVLVSMRGSTGKAKIAKSLEFSQTILNTTGYDAVGIWSFDEGAGPTAFDKSGYGNHGTLVGNTHFVSGEDNTPHWYVNEGQGRSALSFDGSGDYVNCGSNSSLNITDEITIEVWVKPSSSQLTYADIAGNHGGASQGWAIQQSGNNLNLFYFIYGNGASWQGQSLTTQLSTDKWQHFVVLKDETTIRHFLNGSEVGNVDISGNIVPRLPLWIGLGYPNRYFNGSIDEVRIYERALSSSEIQQHYADGAEKHQLVVNN
jgi:prepilin-type N-terminal cleavage/methylation domain-containing protein